MQGDGVSASIFVRAILVVAGALAGVLLWGITENWNNPDLPPLLVLGAFSLVLIQGLMVLLLTGPVAAGRAFAGGLWLALPLSALIVSAGLRPRLATDILDDPAIVSVAFIVWLFAVPFLFVRLRDPARWLDYAALFEAAWALYMRLALALIFVGAFWIVLFLSNALLLLVDVDVIEQLLRRSWISFTLCGGMLGLGLAVLHEFRETLSPFVILRLLRLLVPVMLGVVLIFLLAAPFRELARLFGEFSAAGTLMGTAMVAISLISSALDRSDADAVRTRGLRAATRMLALVLPFLCGLAVWAVALRVAQYGWTPDRVHAASIALFLLGYGLAYAGVSLVRPGWAGRIRQANVVMALAVIALGAATMTPVLNPYRISTNSQVDRFLAGRVMLAELPLWEMSHFWGRAGEDGLSRLEALTARPDHAEIRERIAEARALDSRYLFERAAETRELPARARRLADLLAVRGRESALLPASFGALDPYQLTRWLDACARRLPDGRAACVLVQGDFAAGLAADEQAMILYLDETGTARANYVSFVDGVISGVLPVVDPVRGGWPELPPEVIARALDGEFDIRPSGDNALWVGDAVLVRGN
jgi:hypothetical protein